MARKKDLGKSSALSQEYVIDSDNDGLLEAGSSVQPSSSNVHGSKTSSKKKQRGHKIAALESVVSTESHASDGTVNGEGDGTEASSSSSEGASDEKKSEQGGNVEAMQKSGTKKTACMPIAAPMIVPAKPFRPPNGFQEIQPGLLDFTSDTLKTVSQDLTGKQVWHITAPASIPMSSITVFDVDAVRRGDPVFVHRKKQYCFSPSANDVKHLLLPSDTGSTYKRLKTTIAKSYHLREFSNQFTSSRSENEESPEAIGLFAKDKPDCKPAPKQPTLLRTRYKPFGTDDSPPASTRINGIPVPEEDNIQITLPNSSSPPGSTPKKKEKKSRRPKLSDQNGPENDFMEADVSSVKEMIPEVANSQIGPSLLETPKTTIGVVENEPTKGKKMRKKKKSVEQPSA